MNWQPIFLTFQLAAITTLILLILGIPASYFLSKSTSRFRPVVETLIGLPLVLPPTVLGFYLLLLLSPSGWLGERITQWTGASLLFSFSGLVFGSVIYSLPFMIQPLQAGFSSLPSIYRDASRILGKSELTFLLKIAIPATLPSVLTGVVLTFAHTVGEFGVILMIGGSIPGKTRVASIAVFEEVESMNYGLAHSYSIILILFSFTVLFLVFMYQRKTNQKRL